MARHADFATFAGNLVKFMVALLFAFLFLAQPAVLDDTSKVQWLSPTEHDFGDLKLGVPSSVAFRFKNVSEAPITIDNVRSTCGCTAPDWTEEPIQPGAESAINVEYNSAKPGYFQKKVTVFFSGQRKAEKLSIEGFVE